MSNSDMVRDALNSYAEFYDRVVVALGFSKESLPSTELDEMMIGKITQLQGENATFRELVGKFTEVLKDIVFEAQSQDAFEDNAGMELIDIANTLIQKAQEVIGDDNRLHPCFECGHTDYLEITALASATMIQCHNCGIIYLWGYHEVDVIKGWNQLSDKHLSLHSTITQQAEVIRELKEDAECWYRQQSHPCLDFMTCCEMENRHNQLMSKIDKMECENVK